MSIQLKKSAVGATLLRPVQRSGLDAALREASPRARQWLQATGFQAAEHRHALVPDADGRVGEVWVGVSDVSDAHVLSALPPSLPEGRYRLADDGLQIDAQAAALSWALGCYRFERYRPAGRAPATLVLPPSAAAQAGLQLAQAITRVRDLVNTPAEDLGPAELAEAAKALAKAHGARFKQTTGDALLKAGFPAVHAVGRASTRAPRLIELNWGSPKHPRLTLVGKGVCFDTGGLDIKGADGMRQMKKDMGGAAHALGLAELVMARKLPVQLQVLIPAVDNAIAGNAYRPGDVFRTRAGIHIEIGNTDAEGRVILCDALAYGAESQPDLMVDLATLTGAARVALGPQLPALFSNRFDLARGLMDLGLAMGDPLWHMPLWPGYQGAIESSIGQIVNTGATPQGGAINAALFLQHFVPEAIDWLHVDLFAWNPSARPGRPAGGEAQSLRALLALIEQRYCKK
jgi:leucyl aminopeptidase